MPHFSSYMIMDDPSKKKLVLNIKLFMFYLSKAKNLREVFLLYLVHKYCDKTIILICLTFCKSPQGYVVHAFHKTIKLGVLCLAVIQCYVEQGWAIISTQQVRAVFLMFYRQLLV